MAFDITEACPVELLAMQIPCAADDDEGRVYDVVEADRVIDVSDCEYRNGDVTVNGRAINPGLALLRYVEHAGTMHAQLEWRAPYLDDPTLANTISTDVYKITTWDANNLSMDGGFAGVSRACGIAPSIMAYLMFREMPAVDA